MNRYCHLLPIFALLAGLLPVALPASEAAPVVRGSVIGSQKSVYPDWFSESFLEIAEDAANAGKADKHLIVMFDAEGCPYCFKMVEENFKASPYTDFIRERFETIALDVRGSRQVTFSPSVTLTEKELADLVDIRFTPTLLFLDAGSRTVHRMDGYRPVEDFGHVLHYVAERAYQNGSLSEYLATRERPVRYVLRDHPGFVPAERLADAVDRPVMVLFEDTACINCDELHDNVLALESTRRLMDELTVVRLDASSEEAIVDINGRRTTPAAWARDLGLSYRPATVFFDGGKEVFRVDAYRRTFHYQQSLRYVTGRQWHHYERYRDWARQDREAILASGKNIDVTR